MGGAPTFNHPSSMLTHARRQAGKHTPLLRHPSQAAQQGGRSRERREQQARGHGPRRVAWLHLFGVGDQRGRQFIINQDAVGVIKQVAAPAQAEQGRARSSWGAGEPMHVARAACMRAPALQHRTPRVLVLAMVTYIRGGGGNVWGRALQTRLLGQKSMKRIATSACARLPLMRDSPGNNGSVGLRAAPLQQRARAPGCPTKQICCNPIVVNLWRRGWGGCGAASAIWALAQVSKRARARLRAPPLRMCWGWGMSWTGLIMAASEESLQSGCTPRASRHSRTHGDRDIRVASGRVGVAGRKWIKRRQLDDLVG